uniref:Uncharacterized protein n=1 Tax=Glossina palpalis gambiensis TaxID=67801 RepID=A0A1B0BZF7_9MUSC
MLPDPVEPTTLSRQPAVELLPPEEELASDNGRKLELLEAYKGSISLVMIGVLTGLAIERLNCCCKRIESVILRQGCVAILQSPPFSLPPQFLKP